MLSGNESIVSTRIIFFGINRRYLVFLYKYFGPVHTACTTHIEYLCMSILINTEYFEIRHSLYCLLKRNKKQQETTSTRWCPRINVLLHCCFVSYCLFVSFWYYFIPFWIGYFPFGFFRVTRWSNGVEISMSFLSLSYFLFFFFLSFLLYYVRIDGVTR